MSFNNQIFGCVPNNDFIFSTTNVSSDNASFDNLSVSDTATITNLITTTFNPAAITTTTLTTNILNASTGNISDINTSTITADTAFIADLEITTLDIESISVGTAEIELLQLPDIDPAFTGEESEIQRNGGILTIAGGNMVGAVEKVGQINITPYNLSNTATPSINVAIDGTTTINGQTQIPNITSSFQFIDQNTTYRSGGATVAVISANTTTLSIAAGATENILLTGGATEYINVNPVADETTIRNLDAEGNASFDGNINIVGDITVNAVNSVDVNATDIAATDITATNITATNIVNTNQITATGLGLFKSSFAVMNPVSQTQDFFWNSTAFQLGNLASVDFNIGNDPSNPDKGIIVRGGTNSSVEIPILTADNFSSALSNISTLNVSDLTVDTSVSLPSLTVNNLSVVQNVSIGGDIVEVGNITSAGNLEFFNISAINEVETDNIIANTATFNGDINLTTGTMFGNAVGSFANFTSIGGGSILSTVRIEAPLANISIMNASDITAEDLHVSGGILTADNATVFGNTSTATLTCDLTPNLVAGTGITITSVGGKPTISSLGGGVADPLNISQLNASNISVDLNIDAEDITAINKVEGQIVLGETVQSNGDVICGDDLTVGNNATITRTTITNRIQYNPSSLFWQVSGEGPQPGGNGTQPINFDLAVWDKSGGVFGRIGVGFLVNVSAWYKCSAHVQYRKVSGSNTQSIRNYFIINNSWRPDRGATFSGTAFMNGNTRYANTSLTNTIFFEAGEEVTVAYQAANQPGSNFGTTGIGSVVSTVGSFIYLEYLGGSFNF